jgi:hypothetical protein
MLGSPPPVPGSVLPGSVFPPVFAPSSVGISWPGVTPAVGSFVGVSPGCSLFAGLVPKLQYHSVRANYRL